MISVVVQSTKDAWWPTLHGGPVLLHSVRATLCFNMQKLGEGWAKLSRCVIEFDLGPNMWYNFYDTLLGSLGD